MKPLHIPKPKNLSKYLSDRRVKYAGLGLAAVLGVVLIGSTVSNARSNADADSSVSTPQARSISVDAPSLALVQNESAVVSDASLFITNEELEADLTELVANYLNAKLTLHSEALESLIISDSEIDYKKLARKVEYIESYENIKTYITDGIKGIDYIVYVTYEVKFPMTSSNAPSLEEFYIKETDGTYKLYMNPLSETTSSYVLEQRNKTEIQDLISNTTDELKKALESDSNLLDIYNSFTTNSN